jgi:hypothetical protein
MSRVASKQGLKFRNSSEDPLQVSKIFDDNQQLLDYKFPCKSILYEPALIS